MLALRKQNAALRAYVECAQAIDLYKRSGNGFTAEERQAILERHGFNPFKQNTHEFLDSLAEVALGKDWPRPLKPATGRDDQY